MCDPEQNKMCQEVTQYRTGTALDNIPFNQLTAALYIFVEAEKKFN